MNFVELKEITIYRITHIDNIPHILENGIIHKNSPKKNLGFKNIGDKSLIDTRSTKTLIVDNGDYQNHPIKNITLGDFIPFYFGVRMPML